MRYFGTNVKMHQTAYESVVFVDELAAQRRHPDLQRFVILPFTSLTAVAPAAKRAGMWLGAQHMHWAAQGEYTGEISAAMLTDIGVDLVLIGHAERRTLFGETDLLVERKVRAALAHGLRVLVCVGETADERRCGAASEAIVRQLKFALHGIVDRSAVMVAYEPVWAIGVAGAVADSAIIAETVGTIRDYMGSLPLLYGGSVDAASAPHFAAIPGIDGLFVGRAARTAQGYTAVAREAYPDLVNEGDRK